jgi:hypothetical protein
MRNLDDALAVLTMFLLLAWASLIGPIPEKYFQSVILMGLIKILYHAAKGGER